MNITRILAALVILVGINASAGADDFDDAIAAFQQNDYATAIRLWKPLAEQGNADAQFNLGGMYHDGAGDRSYC